MHGDTCSALIAPDGSAVMYRGPVADAARRCGRIATTRASSGTYRIPVCGQHAELPVLYRIGSLAFGAHAARCESESAYWRHMRRESIGPDARHPSGAACLAVLP